MDLSLSQGGDILYVLLLNKNKKGEINTTTSSGGLCLAPSGAHCLGALKAGIAA